MSGSGGNPARSYDQTVAYDALDAFKRQALEMAKTTGGENLAAHGYAFAEESYGESVALIEGKDHFLAFVVEGLGTKNLVAEKFAVLQDLKIGSGAEFAYIAQDTVAMIANDMAVCGADPLLMGMHLALGNARVWLHDESRRANFAAGWAQACQDIGAKWSGGETPGLRDVVFPETAVISGAALGIIKPKKSRIKGNVRPGDEIVFIKGSGIHANGLTMARDIAEKLPKGYLTPLSDGREFGRHLLWPTPLCTPLFKELRAANVRINYAVHMTGHGYRKLMRLPQSFTYVVTKLPEPQRIFGFMQQHGGMDDREMYATFNMGAVMALIVPQGSAEKVIQIAQNDGPTAFYGGYVDQTPRRRVILEPLGLAYGEEELNIR